MFQITPRPELWYERPGHLRMALHPGEAILSFFDHDTIITKEIGGEIFDAMVPTHTMGENFSSVPIGIANIADDMVVLHLPTSNDGRPTWIFPLKYLDDLLVKEDSPAQ